MTSISMLNISTLLCQKTQIIYVSNCRFCDLHSLFFFFFFYIILKYKTSAAIGLQFMDFLP